MSDWPTAITVDQDGRDFYVREMDYVIIAPDFAIDYYRKHNVHLDRDDEIFEYRKWFVAYLKSTRPQVTSISFYGDMVTRKQEQGTVYRQ